MGCASRDCYFKQPFRQAFAGATQSSQSERQSRFVRSVAQLASVSRDDPSISIVVIISQPQFFKPRLHVLEMKVERAKSFQFAFTSFICVQSFLAPYENQFRVSVSSVAPSVHEWHRRAI